MTDLQALTEMLDAATGGVWEIDPSNGDIVSGPFNVCIPYETRPEDKAAIVALHNAARSMIAELTAAREALREARDWFLNSLPEHSETATDWLNDCGWEDAPRILALSEAALQPETTSVSARDA